MKANRNMREHTIKMHPNGGGGNCPMPKENPHHKEAGDNDNTRENGGKKHPNDWISG